MKEFKFGTVSVPSGRNGPWSIDRFTLSEEDVLLTNLRALRDNPMSYCPAGSYVRLCRDDTVVMSNTPMEIATNAQAYMNAHGVVLMNGLGLGMVLEGILSRSDVYSVTVVERDMRVLELVGTHFLSDKRVEFFHADANSFVPPRKKYDYVWHDIWDDIDPINLVEMAALVARYRPYLRTLGKQGCWSRKMCLDQLRWNNTTLAEVLEDHAYLESLRKRSEVATLTA